MGRALLKARNTLVERSQAWIKYSTVSLITRNGVDFKRNIICRPVVSSILATKF